MKNYYPITIAYDMKQKRAGCALLQATYGATILNFHLIGFDNWLLAPTPEMKLYTLHNENELKRAIEITNKKA